MRIDKNQFIGTAAYLFFIINLFKLPFHVFYWETVSWPTFQINLWLFPVMALGLWTGVRLLEQISTEVFRKLILILTAIGAIAIFMK